MSRARRLLIVVGQGVLLYVGAYAVVFAFCFSLLLPPEARSTAFGKVAATREYFALILLLIVPSLPASWSVFRKLRREYSRHQARRAAAAFAICAPLSMVIGFVLGPFITLPVALPVALFGLEPRLVGFSAAIIGVLVVVASITFAATWLTLSHTSDESEPDQAHL